MIRNKIKLNYKTCFLILILLLSSINNFCLAENNDAIILNAQAYGYYINGNYDNALILYKKAIKLHPKYAPLYDGIGNVYFEKKDYLNAYQNYLESRKLDSSNSLYKIHSQEALIAKYNKTLGDSKILLNKAFSLSNNNNEISKNLENIKNNNYKNLLVIYEAYDNSINSNNKEINFYQNEINKNPKNANTYNNLGVYLCKTNNFKQADKQFEIAINKNNSYALAYNNKAVCKVYETLNNINSSIEFLQNIVKYEQKNIKAIQVLCFLLFLREDYLSSFEILKKYENLAQDNEYYLKLIANNLYALKRFNEAKIYYNKAIALNNKK